MFYCTVVLVTDIILPPLSIQALEVVCIQAGIAYWWKILSVCVIQFRVSQFFLHVHKTDMQHRALSFCLRGFFWLHDRDPSRFNLQFFCNDSVAIVY